MIVYTERTLDLEFIKKLLVDKRAFNARISRLQDYYKGEHDILMRTRPTGTPNNKIIVNYCQNIVDFLTSYLVGVPIQYEAPEVVLDLLKYNDNDEILDNVVDDMNISGYGVELYYTDSDGIVRFSNIDPKEAIFVFDGTLEKRMRAFIRVFPKDDEASTYNVVFYTNTGYTEFILTVATNELLATTQVIPHYFGDVPAILYPNNISLQGSFEQLIPLQNALNAVYSDEQNEYEQNVDSYLVLTGLLSTDEGDIAKMKADRVLLLDKDSGASWLTKTVNNSHIETLKEDILARMKELGHLPDLEKLSGGMGAASGFAIQMKLSKTEIQASGQERVLTKGLRRKFELLYNILKLRDRNIGEFTDVKFNFRRNFIMDTMEVDNETKATKAQTDENTAQK